jgi:hypothetical protein
LNQPNNIQVPLANFLYDGPTANIHDIKTPEQWETILLQALHDQEFFAKIIKKIKSPRET